MFSPRSLALSALLPLAALTALQGAESIELAHGSAPKNPQQPQVAVDGHKGIHVVYGIGDVVCYQKSEDGGRTFTHPIELTFAHAMSLGMRRGPRIAATPGAVCITAIGGKQGKGRDGDLLAMRSNDGGKTWTGPVQVNDADDAAREGLHAMAAGPDGKLCCVWLDLRNRQSEVRAATSDNGGETWSKNVLVYKSPDGDVCPCCHPSVAVDERGRIHVLWRNALTGARDMYLATSTDGGQTFGKATKLGSGTWPLDRCPMDGGGVATANGKLATAWRRDKEVFLATNDGKETRLGTGEQPWIAMTDKGSYVVWLKKRGETAYLLAPGSHTTHELASHAGDAVVAAGPAGKGPVVVAWESRDHGSYSILCRVINE
jgi:hypothetical protein